MHTELHKSGRDQLSLVCQHGRRIVHTACIGLPRASGEQLQPVCNSRRRLVCLRCRRVYGPTVRSTTCRRRPCQAASASYPRPAVWCLWQSTTTAPQPFTTARAASLRLDAPTRPLSTIIQRRSPTQDAFKECLDVSCRTPSTTIPCATVNDGSCTYPIRGCTDSRALNYLSFANTDSGTCILPRPGCMVPSASNYDPLATVHTSTCLFDVRGCTRPTAFNYWPAANIDDGSCADASLGCMDPAAANFDSTANVRDSTNPCRYVARGCTDSDAPQPHNPLSTVDDGSCIPIILGCTINFAAACDSTATL